MEKVKIKEVLQTFLIADELKKEYNKLNNISKYKEICHKITKKYLKYSEKDLWKFITDKDREKRYKSCNWFFGKVKISNTDVWPHMGNINNQLLLKDTKFSANQIFKNSNKISKKELNHLFRISLFATFLNKHVPIIVLQDSNIRNENKYFKQKYDIDDGNHRAICLALLEVKYIK